MGLIAATERVRQRLASLTNRASALELAADLTSEQAVADALREEDEAIHPRLREEFLGSGPLAHLLTDEAVTEIVVNGPRSIWVERDGVFSRHNDEFLSDQTFANFIDRMSAECGMVTNLHSPCGDGDWRGFRVHVMRPPLAERIQLTLRGRPRSTWTLDRLAEAQWATHHALQVLRDWLKARKNFLIVGPTGSGKTSVLNACLQELPADERVLCLEDTSELCPRGGASCKLLTRKDQNNILRDFDLGDLVRQSLRMRPHRLVIGEVRGAEARDLLLALATGHSGSLGTLHAADAGQALLRLEMLVQLGAGQWSLEAIRHLIHLSLDGIVVTKIEGGKRRLKGIYRIASRESVGFLLEEVSGESQEDYATTSI